MTDTFTEALHSSGPDPDHAGKLTLYGRFIGAWTFDAMRTLEDGTKLTGRGEVHFGWVLEGKAVQDVWILPARDAGPAFRPRQRSNPAATSSWTSRSLFMISAASEPKLHPLAQTSSRVT